MRQVTMILGAVSVVLALAGVASATLLDNFETGYTDGITVDGQNGWSNVYGGGDTVSSTAGRGGGWGLVNDANASGWNASRKEHGIPMASGTILVYEADIKQTGDTSIGWTMQDLEFEAGASGYLQFSVDNNANTAGVTSYRLGYGGQFNDVQPAAGYTTGDWMHMKLTWNLGTDIRAVLTDASNNVLWDHSHALTAVPAFTSIYAGSIQINTATQAVFSFDNISVTTIPEPSTLALLMTGAIGLLCYAWRKRR
jgi:hypothetical protein